MSTSPRTRTTHVSSPGSTSTRASSLIRTLPSQPPPHPYLRTGGAGLDLHRIHELADQVEPVPSSAGGRGPPASRISDHQLDVMVPPAQGDHQDVLACGDRMLVCVAAGCA